jgi:hypothetical protein
MTDSPDTAPSLEATLAAWEEQLAGLERRATAALRSARRLRKAAQEGTIAGLPAAVATMRQDADELAVSVGAVAEPPALNVAEAFANGAYVEELAAAAKAADVRLIQRDGRITAFPVVVRLEPRSQGVRLGRKLEKRLRPSVLIGELKKLQSRPNRFNARSFLDRLLRAYAILAPQWQPNKAGEGPLIALADLHEVLTLWPQAAADYPVEEFLCDMLRLNRLPDSRTGRGHLFELGGSTGTKGAKRLSAFDETGTQHDFYAIRFAMD